MNMKNARWIALLLCLVFCLSSCGNEAQLSDGNADIHLPEPEEHETQMIIGDARSEMNYDVSLHYASRDTLSLSTVTRTVSLAQNESLIERTLDALIEAASQDGAVEAKIEQTETGSGIVNVNLSLEAGVNRSDQDYLLLCASIANTLLQFDDVEAVNILTGNRCDPVSGLPLGAFVNAQDNIAALYAQIQSESERFPSDSGAALLRNVLLYFPSGDGNYMLPEVRELAFSGNDYVSTIIQALCDGPLVRSCSISAIPGNMDFLESAPEIIVSDRGERIIELHFSSMLRDYLDFAAVEDWQLYASLALTLCSFVPEIDAIRVYIDQDMITGCALGRRTLAFENGMMRRADFAATIGSSAHLYFANGNDKLTRSEIPMARHASASPLNLLQELVSALPLEDVDGSCVFPEGITKEDILGVSVNQQIATINLSGNFYAACQSLSMQQERQLVYAMINTLGELNGIHAVQFLVEGEALDFLAQNIYLGNSLMPDPGLIYSGDDMEESETE